MIQSALLQEKLVAVKTDTVWGLACLARKAAIESLFQLKARTLENPVVLMVESVEPLREYFVIDQLTERLIDEFWPGALTLVLPIKSEYLKSSSHFSKTPPLWLEIFQNFFPDLDAIGLRIPNQVELLDLLKLLGEPLVVTSANLSGEHTIESAEEIKNQWGSQLAGILGEGWLSNLPSTVISVRGRKAEILRRGEGINEIEKLFK